MGGTLGFINLVDFDWGLFPFSGDSDHFSGPDTA